MTSTPKLEKLTNQQNHYSNNNIDKYIYICVYIKFNLLFLLCSF